MPLLQAGIKVDNNLVIKEEDKLSLKDSDFKNPILLRKGRKKKN